MCCEQICVSSTTPYILNRKGVSDLKNIYVSNTLYHKKKTKKSKKEISKEIQLCFYYLIDNNDIENLHSNEEIFLKESQLKRNIFLRLRPAIVKRKKTLRLKTKVLGNEKMKKNNQREKKKKMIWGKKNKS